jgi:hypothetical protein
MQSAVMKHSASHIILAVRMSFASTDEKNPPQVFFTP